MKFSPIGLLACLAAAPIAADAVTVTTNSLGVSTTVGTNTVTTNPNTQQISGGSSPISAQGNALVQTGLGGGSWEFNGLNTAALLSAVRGGNGTNGPVTASASAVYTIAFTLGVGESAEVSFNTGYNLQESGTDGVISWNLTGPQSGFSGSVTTAGSGSITPQQVTLNTAGSYTFTLSGSIPGAIDRNQSASVTLSNINFQIVAIPEPGVAALGIFSLGVLAFRRRRIPA